MPDAVIDGIHYELVEDRTMNCISSYTVNVDGKKAMLANVPIQIGKTKPVLENAPTTPRPVVVILHHGSSGASRWTIHAGGKRYALDTQPEVFDALAKMIHG